MVACLLGNPRGRAYAAGAPLLVSKAGGKPAGRGISISPSLHPPLETTKKGELRFPLLGTSPKLSYRQLTGGEGLLRNAFAARTPPQAPRYFGGMAPTAARRAKLVQRSSFQGLQGNPDACRPRRGSACSVSADRAGGNADPVFALPVQATAAMSPRFGGSGGEAPDPSFPPFLWEEMGAPAGQARPARGTQAWERGNPSSVWPSAIHLPPSGGKASGG